MQRGSNSNVKAISVSQSTFPSNRFYSDGDLGQNFKQEPRKELLCSNKDICENILTKFELRNPLVRSYLLGDADSVFPEHLHQFRHLEHERAFNEILEVRIDAGADPGIEGVPGVLLDVNVVANQPYRRPRLPQRVQRQQSGIFEGRIASQPRESA